MPSVTDPKCNRLVRSPANAFDHITFALCAQYAANSPDCLRRLLQIVPTSSLTLFSGSYSRGISAETLQNIESTFSTEARRCFMDIRMKEGETASTRNFEGAKLLRTARSDHDILRHQRSGAETKRHHSSEGSTEISRQSLAERSVVTMDCHSSVIRASGCNNDAAGTVDGVDLRPVVTSPAHASRTCSDDRFASTENALYCNDETVSSAKPSRGREQKLQGYSAGSTGILEAEILGKGPTKGARAGHGATRYHVPHIDRPQLGPAPVRKGKANISHKDGTCSSMRNMIQTTVSCDRGGRNRGMMGKSSTDLVEKNFSVTDQGFVVPTKVSSQQGKGPGECAIA